MGTRDGRTQSARACKPALLHLALRTFGFRTSVFWLWGPGFQDLDKRTLGFTLRTWVSVLRFLLIGSFWGFWFEIATRKLQCFSRSAWILRPSLLWLMLWRYWRNYRQWLCYLIKKPEMPTNQQCMGGC